MKKNNRLLDLFFASLTGEWYSQTDYIDIFGDINGSYKYNFYSERYNDHHFNIDTEKNRVYVYSVKSKDFTHIIKFSWGFIPTNIKVWKAMRRVKYNIKNKDKIKAEEHLTSKVANVIEEISSDKNMVVKLRKGKLESLKNKNK